MSAPRGPLPRTVATSFLVDLLLVLVFVLIGRRSHDEDSAILGTLTTLWPFAAALAAGWLVALGWRAPHRIVPTGLSIWAVTVVGGVLLRAASGQGVQASFVVVTAIVLGVLLLGRRALVLLVARRRR